MALLSESRKPVQGLTQESSGFGPELQDANDSKATGLEHMGISPIEAYRRLPGRRQATQSNAVQMLPIVGVSSRGLEVEFQFI